MGVPPEFYDDFILELEGRQGEHLSKLDDNAIKHQAETLRRARKFIPD